MIPQKGGMLAGLLLLTLLTTTACSQEAQWAGQNEATFAAMNLIESNSTCTTDHISTTTTSFFVLLTTGLLTGLSHCVGMCGPLVGAFAMRRRAERQELSTPLVLFQLLPLAVRIVTALAFGDHACARDARNSQVAHLPSIRYCRQCRGEVLENGEQCEQCGNPLWEYKWLTAAD